MYPAAVLIGLAALVLPPSASANVSHEFSFDFGSATSTPANLYPLTEPTDVEVDQTNHDIYVTDPGHHRVEKFDSAGNLLLMFGKNVNKTKVETAGTTEGERDVCEISSGNICQSGESSSSSGGFEDPYFLAVDNYKPSGEGDVYVGDVGDDLVSKFSPSGQIITSWGEQGQKNGSDATDLPDGWQPVYGVAVGGGCATPISKNTGKCVPNGTLYVGGARYNTNIYEYTRSGEYIKWSISGSQPWLKASPEGVIYSGGGPVEEAIPVPGEYQDTNDYQVTTESPTTGLNFDPSSEELYQDTGSEIDHYSATCNPPLNGPCQPVDGFGATGNHLSEPKGVGVDGESHAVYVANSGSGNVAVFSDVRPVVTTEPPSEASETEVTLTGHIDPKDRGEITECYFEWGLSKAYGNKLPCSPTIPPNYSGPTTVNATVTGLSPGTKDHYRLVATNSAGSTAEGIDELLYTTQPPAINGLVAENVTATSAELKAEIIPNGLETSYYFEYGPTVNYGHTVPVPAKTIRAGNAGVPVAVSLEGLIPHDVYHYRLVTNNETTDKKGAKEGGPTDSADQTFNFYPPSCPNENVRQQTQTNYLPDCRAYELVSPENAGGTQLSPDGPNTGYATSPPRFSFTGTFSSVPGSGGEPIDSAGDLYVATRTDSGWVTRYVGWPSSQAAVDGGPALGPPDSIPYQVCREPYSESCFRAPSAVPAASGIGPASQNGVYTDPGMNRFLSFNDGNQSIESIFGADFQNRTIITSNAPDVISADGTILDRWPTNLNVVPSGSYPEGSYIIPGGLYRLEPGEGEYVRLAPSGSHSLDCPYVAETTFFYDSTADDCPGDVTASADLSHFIFATEWNVFATGGQLSAPGSVYDNNTVTKTVAVASLTPSGEGIPEEPTDLAGDTIQIPGVSSDGSHILMDTGGTGPCGHASCGTPPCGGDYNMVRRCIMQPGNLYMRVDDSVTYDVSQGHNVIYLGETGAGSKVYFESEEQLTPEDKDTSMDIYMWSEKGAEEGHPLTLISKGDNPGGAGEPGNTDSCDAQFTTKCNVTTYTQLFFCGVRVEEGGNCLSDNSIASESGDIYFFSPEQLDGTRGIPNQENLYVYHEGHVQFVTTLVGPPDCYETYSSHECTRVERMQVSPEGNHMAFVSNAQITQYNNAGYQEMYTYEPSTRKLTCVSCIPNGTPPTSNVEASQDGLFMTNDGRTFFSTNDALVHGDTNQGEDVYEYVNGRPQLITAGTGQTSQPKASGLGGLFASPGLIGVSADGTDVYFSTYDTLVPQDHNGLFLKFYDARTNGGFSAPPPPLPCNAAEECHGAGSELPQPLVNGSSAALGAGGQLDPQGTGRPVKGRHPRRGKQHRRHHRRAHRRGRK